MAGRANLLIVGALKYLLNFIMAYGYYETGGKRERTNEISD